MKLPRRAVVGFLLGGLILLIGAATKLPKVAGVGVLVAATAIVLWMLHCEQRGEISLEHTMLSRAESPGKFRAQVILWYVIAGLLTLWGLSLILVKF